MDAIINTIAYPSIQDGATVIKEVSPFNKQPPKYFYPDSLGHFCLKFHFTSAFL